MGVLTTDHPTGNVVEVLTQGSGPLRAIVGSGGGGSGSVANVISVPAGDREFDGIGAGSTLKLEPGLNILVNVGSVLGVTWNFLPDLVEPGTIVLLAIDSSQNGSSVELQDTGVTIGTVDSFNAPLSQVLGTPFALYFNGEWLPLACRMGNPTI